MEIYEMDVRLIPHTKRFSDNRPNMLRNNTHTTQVFKAHKVAPEHITALKVSVSACLLLAVFGCFIDLKGVGMFSGGRPRKSRILLPLLLGVVALLFTVLLWAII